MVAELLASIPIVDSLEVIIVDDFSTDDFSIFSGWGFVDHRLIRNYLGTRYAGAARNFGIESANGEYLLFADSDDLIVDEGLTKCLLYLESHKPDILFAKSTSFKHDNGELGTRHLRGNWLVECVFSGQPSEILARIGGPCAKFIRRDFILKHNLRFETQRYSNDIVFSASLITSKPKVDVIDAVVYAIREGNDSLTRDVSIESTTIRLEALWRYNNLLQSNGLAYLRAPALPLLLRLLRKDVGLTCLWAWRSKIQGTPVFMTTWTLKNLVMRWLGSSEMQRK